MIRPTGRSQQERERAQAIARERSDAANLRRVRLDEVAAMAENRANELEAEVFAWPNGLTRERVVVLIAKARPDVVLDDATDAYCLGMFDALVKVGRIDLSGEEMRRRDMAHAAAMADVMKKSNEQLGAFVDKTNAERISVKRDDGEPDPFDPVANGVGAWASPPIGTKKKRKTGR